MHCIILCVHLHKLYKCVHPYMSSVDAIFTYTVHMLWIEDVCIHYACILMVCGLVVRPLMWKGHRNFNLNNCIKVTSCVVCIM